MEGKQRELEADADGDEGESGRDCPRILHRGRSQPRGNVDHVKGAGQKIEQADAENVEGGADRSHDQVLEGSEKRAPVGAEGDQNVSGQRRDLEKHEGIERVTGHCDAEQSGEAEQEHAIEPGLPVFRDLEVEGAVRERHDHGGDRGDQHQHEAIEDIDAVFDAPRGLPAAVVLGNGAGGEHLPQHRS
jgi:hypothetical protein